MATIIQWGANITYDEKQVVSFSPTELGERFTKFERINKSPVLFTMPPPLKGYNCELYFHPNNCASPIAEYEALESRFLQPVAISADLTLYGVNKGKYVLSMLTASYDLAAGSGKPLHITVKANWLEDAAL